MSTIVAISTAPAIGGIGIIRISGKDSFNILGKIFIPKKPQKIEEINGYTIKYGSIVEKETNRVIDEVLVSYFKEPKSYTTENMCEINSHGGIVVLREILELCLKNGARLAEPGEFTKRAFINGRIDLTQAEAIIDIINAKTTREARESANQLKGSLSKKINGIRDELLNVMTIIEANIDYPEYDVEEITNKQIEETLENVKMNLINLLESFKSGKILKEGIKVAILGKPNSGKSSLLNTILKEERAIVTDIAGTTRDTIEEQVVIQGIPFKFIDTAGIRNAEDQIEKIGIEKTYKVAEESDVIVALFDNSKQLEEEDKKILNFLKNRNAIIVLNKIDIVKNNLENLPEIKNLNKKIIKMSIKNEEGLVELYNELINMFNLDELNMDNELIITNIRHKNLINKAVQHIQMSLNELKEDTPIDIISISIKQILEDLGEITGDNISEDIIKSIFSKFCLGK